MTATDSTQLSGVDANEERLAPAVAELVAITVQLSGAELLEAAVRAQNASVSLKQWLSATALLEAWRVVHDVERSWPWALPRTETGGAVLKTHFSLEAVDALHEAVAQIFFWVGDDLRHVDLSEFVNGAIRRRLSMPETRR